MKNDALKAAKSFIASVDREIGIYLRNIDMKEIEKAAEIILDTQAVGGRLHITGIGKPAHVATYAASLLSSTGCPCYFLHGTEAVHGSCGQLAENDTVICISNSGETAELKATAIAIRNNGCRLVAVTGNAESWLAKICDVYIIAKVEEEGGPLNRAPRNSVLAEMIALQTLSVVLQTFRDWTPQQYVRCHPGGTLGKLKAGE